MIRTLFINLNHTCKIKEEKFRKRDPNVPMYLSLTKEKAQKRVKKTLYFRLVGELFHESFQKR
jgi:hypothetical protein